MDLKFSKQNQTAYKKKRKRPTVTVSEDEMQDQCNNILKVLGLKYIRIPDWVWNWLIHNAPVQVNNYMSEMFAGMPDVLVPIQVSEKYNLLLQLELKTEAGKLSNKQKKWAEKTAVQVSRGVKQNKIIIEEFVEFSDKLRKFLLKQ